MVPAIAAQLLPLQVHEHIIMIPTAEKPKNQTNDNPLPNLSSRKPSVGVRTISPTCQTSAVAEQNWPYFSFGNILGPRAPVAP
jgi:hypothetical protein